MNAANRPGGSGLGVENVLRTAMASFAAFPAPAVAYFALLAAWGCYGTPSGELNLTDLMSFDPADTMSEALLWLAGSLLTSWVMCGLARVAILGARGRQATWDDTVVSLRDYFHAASALTTCWILAGCGLLLFLVPGLLLFLMWSQAFCAALDSRQGWLSALHQSRRITAGHYGLIGAVYFVTFLLSLPSEAFSGSTLAGSLPDLDSLLNGATGSAAAPATIPFDSTARTLLMLSSVLAAAAATASSYIGAALYVALQDAAGTEATGGKPRVN